MRRRILFVAALIALAAVVGARETQRPGSRIHYPLNPTRKVDLKPEAWWSDVPQRELGPHDGLPDRPATQG